MGNFFEQYHRIGKNGAKYWGRMGAGIVFTNGKQILLLKRATGGDHPNYWCIPGGKAKEGEVAIETARRESMEECGHNEGRRFANFDVKDGNHHFHTYLYFVPSLFNVKLSKEHTDSEWVDLDSVKGMKLHPKFAESWPVYQRSIEKNLPLKTFKEWFTTKFSVDENKKVI